MTEQEPPERRKRDEKSPAVQLCPWCGGRLVLQNRFPLRKMIPGDGHARAEDGIPESLRTIRAWVCATPHCKYRETAY
jgi:hypothetical protein